MKIRDKQIITLSFFGGFMKLQTVKRAADKKSEAKKLRREGFIPAFFMPEEKAGETIAVNGK